MHWWSEPVRRARVAAAAAGVPLACPRVGERVDLTLGEPDEVARKFNDQWWEQCAAPEDRD
jgi:hypothetical protein